MFVLCLLTSLKILTKGTMAFTCVLFYFVYRYIREYKEYYKHLATITSRNHHKY